ncbi:MAG: hypothetical protein H7Y38_09055 [Armatimonadetes bacterium]|nr:hypothetical protein [Armatimonadota bacterium]
MRTTKLRFRFELTPLAKIEPWGDDKPNLHWFGLTDGLFWIEAGDTELFRYTDAINAHWAKQYPQTSKGYYERYPIASYHDDLLSLLEVAPIPYSPDFSEAFFSAKRSRTLQSAAVKSVEPIVSENQHDIGKHSPKWWAQRRWSASHLLHPPNVWLWREADSMRLYWDNRAVTTDNIPVWTAKHGELSFTVNDFVDAVRAFDGAFIRAMDERVQTVLDGGLSPHIHVDLAGLRWMHDNTAKSLDRRLWEAQDQIDFHTALVKVQTALRERGRTAAWVSDASEVL